MTEYTCDHRTLFSPSLSAADKCTFLSQTCADDQEFFNFFRVYLCYLHGNTPIFIALALILIVLLFRFICAVVEEYIAPAIVYLSKYLKLSEALAGVTLLAFANGAGDVVTAIVAADSKEGISYNVGALYGAGLFVLTLVMAITIKKSPNAIVVSKSVIYRDIGIYIVATLLTLVFALIGELNIFSALCFLGLYGVLVGIVMYQDSLDRKRGIKPDHDTEDDEKESLHENMEVSMVKQKRFSEIFIQLNRLQIDKLKSLFDHLYNYVKNRQHIREQNQGAFGRFLDRVDIPFKWMRQLTIPPVEPDEYDHRYAVAWPLLGIPFMVWATTFNPQKWWVLLIPIALGLSFALRTFRPKRDDQIPRYFLLLVLAGIFSGILWTNLLCGLLVDILTVIGVVTNLSTTYLGLTILAVGNALPDALTTIAIAKQGKAIMGITGGIAGQVFGLLVGFGTALLKKTAKGPVKFNLFDTELLNKNMLLLIVVFVALGTMLFILAYGIGNKLRFDNRMANVLIAIYASFIGVTTIIAVYQAIKYV